MSTSITKGPAFEIRFCEGNKVQVYDLSRRGDKGDNKLLPNEYLEDDVVNGRLRYSKLGNQWLSNDTDTKQHHQQQLAAIPDDLPPKSLSANEDNNKNGSLDVIPVLAKQKAIEDAKELESIRQGEEAMRKAMERKMKIEMARRARQKAAAEAESSINLEVLAHKDDAPQDGSGDKDEYDNNTHGPMNEQDPQRQFEAEKDIPLATEENRRSTRTNQKLSLLHNDIPPPTTPLPNRQQMDSASSAAYTTDTAASIVSSDHENSQQHLQKPTSPPPSFTTTAATVERPDHIYHPQITPNQHYYPQQQQYGQQGYQQQHVHNSYQTNPPINQQQPVEDSFFHEDGTNNKTKSSSGCCCIIS